MSTNTRGTKPKPQGTRRVTRPVERRPDDTTATRLILGFWAAIILLWAAGVFRAIGSLVVLAAAAAATVLVLRDLFRNTKGDIPLRAIRRWVVVVLLVLQAAVIDTAGTEPFALPRAVIAVAAAAVVLGLWALSRLTGSRWPELRNGLQWPALAFLAWSVLSTAFSPNVALSLHGYFRQYDSLPLTIAYVVAMFAAAEACPRLRDVKSALMALYLAGGGLISVFGVLQFHDAVTDIGGRWLWLRFFGGSFGDKTITATLGNPNHVAGFAIALLPVGAVLFTLQEQRRTKVLIAAIAGCLTLFAIVNTTRGAWLAAVPAFVVTALIVRPARPSRRAVLVTLAAAAVVAATFSLLAATGSLRYGVSTLTSFGSDSTLAERGDFWRAAVVMTGERPVFGWGFEGYQDNYPRYQSRSHAETFGADRIINGPHNSLLSIAVTRGLPALAAFLALVVVAGLRVIGAVRRLPALADSRSPFVEFGHEARLLLAGVAGAACGLFAQSMFNVDMPALNVMLWASFGLVASITAAAGVPNTMSPRRLLDPSVVREDEAATVAAPADGWVSGILRGVGAMVVGALMIAAVALAFRPWVAMRRMTVGNQQVGLSDLSALQGRAGVQMPLLGSAFGHYKSAHLLDPLEPAYWEGMGRIQQAMAELAVADGEIDKAREAFAASDGYFRRAVDIVPDNELLLWGRAAVLQRLVATGGGRPATDELVATLRHLAYLNPWQPKYWVAYSGSLRSAGRLEASTAAARRGLTYAPRNADLERLSEANAVEGDPG